MNKLTHYIYAYIREDGTPYYIGKGKGQRAWNKHNRKNGNSLTPKNIEQIVILERNLTDVGALALERRLIRWWGRKDLATGILLNLTDGGEGASGAIRSSETRKKISNAQVGKTVSVEVRQKISKSKTGISRTDEECQKISNGKFGKKHTLESCNKMSNVAKNRSIELRLKFSMATKNKKWYNNGEISRMFSEESVLPGFVKGRINVAA